MLVLNPVTADKVAESLSFIDEADETVANMDETDWMAMMMEMRIFSA